MQRSANWQVQSVSPDGRWLLVWSTSNLYLLSTAGDGTLEPFLETPFAKFGARIAPTGDHVAFHSFESGAMEVYVTTFPAAGRRMRVSTAGGTLPQWRGDGAELYFQRGLSIMAVAVTPAPSEPAGARLGLPQKLFDLPPGSVAWQPAKDGQRFLVSLQVADAVPAPTTVVLNWPAGLKK